MSFKILRAFVPPALSVRRPLKAIRLTSVTDDLIESVNNEKLFTTKSSVFAKIFPSCLIG